MKSVADSDCNTLLSVSLFTREWIEIKITKNRIGRLAVSLFTREWIEIMVENVGLMGVQVSLFTREWIEILPDTNNARRERSPSLRGSGLKLFLLQQTGQVYRLPLYEGVD